MASAFNARRGASTVCGGSARRISVRPHSTQSNVKLGYRPAGHVSPSGLPHSLIAFQSNQDVRTRASKDSDNGCAEDDLEVKVETVRMQHGCVVYLKIVGTGLSLPVHIGDAEGNAILKELNKLKQPRPLTHDFARALLQACGFRVTKIRITELVQTTYYSRVYIGKFNRDMVEYEADVDARPSDAINLALRFGAPMYVSKHVAKNAITSPSEISLPPPESHAEIARSVRAMLSSFEDPTIMIQLQKSVAIEQQRYEDAQVLQQRIFHEMTHNQLLRLAVAMEAALSDARYEEAARLRDEYREMVQMVTVNKGAAI